MESAPPETAHVTGVPGAGKEQRARRSPARTGLLLGLYATLTAVRVLGCAHFGDVANDSLGNSADGCQEQRNTEPVVPDICRDHVVSLSEHVLAKASFEAVDETGGEFVALCLDLDGILQFGVELECALTINTDFQMVDDLVRARRGELLVQESVEFFEGFVAIGHVSDVGVGG